VLILFKIWQDKVGVHLLSRGFAFSGILLEIWFTNRLM
jgi:hypothetical protein